MTLAPFTSTRSAKRPMILLLVTLLVGLQLGLPSVARAEPAPRPLLTQGLKLRTAGIAVTLIGAGLVIAGGTVIGVGLARESRDSYSAVTGLTALSVGGAAFFTGIPLWVVGQNRITEARESERPTVRLVPAPAGSVGASLGLTF